MGERSRAAATSAKVWREVVKGIILIGIWGVFLYFMVTIDQQSLSSVITMGVLAIGGTAIWGLSSD
jgi:hypothetical protein